MNRQERRRLERDAEKIKREKLDNDKINPNPNHNEIMYKLDPSMHAEIDWDEDNKRFDNLGVGSRMKKGAKIEFVKDLVPHSDGFYYLKDQVKIDGYSLRNYREYMAEASDRFNRYLKEIIGELNIHSSADSKIYAQRAVALIDNDFELTCFWIMIGDIWASNKARIVEYIFQLKKCECNLWDFLEHAGESCDERIARVAIWAILTKLIKDKGTIQIQEADGSINILKL